VGEEEVRRASVFLLAFFLSNYCFGEFCFSAKQPARLASASRTKLHQATNSPWAAVLYNYTPLCPIKTLSRLPAFCRAEKERSRFIYRELCKELSWLPFHIHVPAAQHDFMNVYDMAYFLLQLCPSGSIFNEIWISSFTDAPARCPARPSPQPASRRPPCITSRQPRCPAAASLAAPVRYRAAAGTAPAPSPARQARGSSGQLEGSSTLRLFQPSNAGKKATHGIPDEHQKSSTSPQVSPSSHAVLHGKETGRAPETPG